MENQKSLSTPENSIDYWKPSHERRWEVCYDYKTKFYLTDSEKDFFLSELDKGITIIQIKDLILTPRIQYILPVMEKSSPKKYKEIIGENGDMKYVEE